MKTSVVILLCVIFVWICGTTGLLSANDMISDKHSSTQQSKIDEQIDKAVDAAVLEVTKKATAERARITRMWIVGLSVIIGLVAMLLLIWLSRRYGFIHKWGGKK